MGVPKPSHAAFTGATTTRLKSGTATAEAEQRFRAGRGLHELVDPKGFGVIRRSITWLEPKGKQFILLRGVAMLVENRVDTTGSMGGNVDVAMRVLPDTYKLLSEGPAAVLRRYDTQIINAIFGDIQDRVVLCRSQAETDLRIAEQLAHMVPERDGGDGPEDPEYGLFGAAYLTWCSAVEMGLKSYDFTTTDAPSHGRVSKTNLTRVFGDEVFEKVAENGHQIKEGNLPNTSEIVSRLLKRAHAFLLQVGENRSVTEYWAESYGRERVVKLPSTELLPPVQAAIIGLTEGVLDLQGLAGYLKENAGLSVRDAEHIKRAVAGIPIGAQMMQPNFDKIPSKGAVYAKKGDLWPVGFDQQGNKVEGAKGGGVKKGEKVWL